MFNFKTLSALSLFTALLVQATPVKLADGSKTILGRDAANPTPTPGPLEWQYYGCFEDKEGDGRIFPLRPMTLIPAEGTTTDLCIQACKLDGYFLAGLETGSECWCSNFEKTPEASLKELPNESCNVPCTGNTTATCGGAWAMQIHAYLPPKA